MCKWNPKNVIYLSILWGRHHPVSCSDLLWGYTLKSSYWCIILMFVCLPSILWDPKQHTKILFSIFRLVSSEHPQPASYCTVHTLGGWRLWVQHTALCKLAGAVSWQTSNCHLVSCICCLISLFWIRLICQHTLKIKCSNDAKLDFQSMIPSAFFFLIHLHVI